MQYSIDATGLALLFYQQDIFYLTTAYYKDLTTKMKETTV
jgi:hypothetical protein